MLFIEIYVNMSNASIVVSKLHLMIVRDIFEQGVMKVLYFVKTCDKLFRNF
jgi:hypothetical protein